MTQAGSAGLVAHLDDLRELTRELRGELPHVNDPQLHPTIATLVDTANAVFAAHGSDPKPSIADDLSVLMSAVRALRIPARDPDLESRTPTLDRLRKSKGLLVAGLADALDSAAAIGLIPQKAPIPGDIAAALPRSEIEGLLGGISRRLEAVEKSLDALDAAPGAPTHFTQQNGLLNFYTGAMRVEIDLAKLHLTVGDKSVDFNALARIVETMSGLTSDFVATVRAWAGRVADQVIDVANQVPRQIRKVASGVKASAHWVVRTIRRRRAADDAILEAKVEVKDLATTRKAPNFDINLVREMILFGQKPPDDWVPYITELDFSGTRLGHLASLASLTSLRSLDLEETNVSNLAPLAHLTGLQSLNLRKTQVSNFVPLAGLTDLRSLDLGGTWLIDLALLAGLTNLQSLSLGGTRVSNLTPLARLTGLLDLNLRGIPVSNLEPLARLTNLQKLDLRGTPVSDLAPLAGLASLQSFSLQGTPVSDLAALARLISLERLYLNGTLVTDLAPLAGLTSLQTLHLGGTHVRDLAPLAGLASLQLLRLQRTRVSDLAPLAGLASLQLLDLRVTQVNDLAPVAHVAQVIMPNGSIRESDSSPRRRRE